MSTVSVGMPVALAPARSLQVVADVVVGLPALQARLPQRCGGVLVVGDGRLQGAQVGGVVGPQFAGAQVDGAVGDVEQPWVGVEVFVVDEDARHAAGEADHRGDGAGGVRI